MPSPFLPNKLLRLVVIGALIAGATSCYGMEPSADDIAGAQELLVPNSTACDRGVGPNKCTFAPPVSPSHPFNVNGVRALGEYSGSLQLPCSDIRDRAPGGKLFVSVVDFGGTSPQRLNIFGEQLPFNQAATEVILRVDSNRFSTTAPSSGNDVTVEDGAYVINLASGAASYRKVVTPGPAWAAGTAPAPFTIVRSACGVVGVIKRCNFEWQITLPTRAMAPGIGLLPGIGLAIGDNTYSGGLPESVARVALTGTDPSLIRNNYETVLFGDNRTPVRFISWNVQRFNTFDKAVGAPHVFSDATPLASIAQVVAPFDVIAMQELWSTDQAETLLTEINSRRATLGLGTVHMFGPVQFPPGILAAILKNPLTTDADLHGGLFIYSRFPAIAQGSIVYDSCRDLDCIKSKGAQWVRLSLADSTTLTASQTKDCLFGSPTLGRSCPRAPSGDEFIDVFNTHLQADDSTACFFGGGFDPTVVARIRETYTGGFFDAIDDVYLGCLQSPASVRVDQLTQLGAFVAGVTADAPDRSSILMGDFNLNGRPTGGATFGSEYTTMLDLLAIRPAGGVAADHLISARPTDFAWDIDYGDVACLPSGTANGDVNTSIVPGGGHDELNPPPGELWNVGARYDYVLVRPGVRAGSVGADRANYIIGLGDGTGLPTRLGCNLGTDPWCGWFPGIVDRNPSGLASGPPEQFSDHKPVIGNLMVVSLREPPPYHPDFNHNYVFRITTFDATGESDCALGLCNPVDPLVQMTGFRQPFGGTLASFVGPVNTTVCNSTWSAARGTAPCMANWQTAYNGVRSSNTARVRSQARMLEDDLGPTDVYPTMAPGDHPLMDVILLSGIVQVRDFTFWLQPNGWTDQTLRNSDPIRWCTRDRPINMCLETRLDEVAP